MSDSNGASRAFESVRIPAAFARAPRAESEAEHERDLTVVGVGRHAAEVEVGWSVTK